MFYAKVFKEFLFVFLYLIMCIVFKIHPFCFLFVLDSFLCSIRKYMYGEERPYRHACVKTWITCWSWSVLLATDSNSTVLHFDSLNNLMHEQKCHSVNLSSINMEVTVLKTKKWIVRIFWCSILDQTTCIVKLSGYVCWFRKKHRA